MKRTWTIIGVDDVAGSFKWYHSLFGQSQEPAGFGDILTPAGARASPRDTPPESGDSNAGTCG